MMTVSPVRVLLVLAASIAFAGSPRAAEFDVRSFGATGNGETVDSPAINRAIEAAAAAGGGTVRFPAGTYLSFSIRLKSNLTLQFDAGSILLAASPAAAGSATAGTETGGYDIPEPNEWGEQHQYQDFGHSHWHNSLIWGENLENISIVGPGLIHGKGLSRSASYGGGGGGRRGGGPGAAGAPAPGAAGAGAAPQSPPAAVPPPQGGQRGEAAGRPANLRPGVGNKAIGLVNCRNVTIRDVSLLLGGHFALLATGLDNLTLDNVKVDTNRDGFDIDCCRNVRVSNCSVNAPNDDGIVLKTSYALGVKRACENITITNCQVTGYDAGTFLDGTFKRTMERAPDRDGPTGRIKLGTESDGDFRNITISNCVFNDSRGLALETVDGGVIEDIAINNITMRDIVTAPIFFRIGNRARGPEGTPVGAIRRVTISNVVVSNADSRYASIIAGLPGHPVEDVTLSDIRILYKGGLTPDQVAQQPAEMVNTFFLRGPGLTGPRDPFNPPEQEKGYPEPSMFGLLPASGLYVRHAKNLSVRNLDVSFITPDQRPAVVLDDVAGATFVRLAAQRVPGIPLFTLRSVSAFSTQAVTGLADVRRDQVESESLGLSPNATAK